MPNSVLMILYKILINKNSNSCNVTRELSEAEGGGHLMLLDGSPG